MDVRAAVAYAAGKPLEVTDVELDGPRAGEVLVEIKATGICHTDEFTLLGRRSGRAVPGDPRPRGRRHRRRRRPRRHLGEEGRPRHSALHAGMPPVQVLPVAQDQSVHRDPRHPGQGRDAGRHHALLASAGKTIHHYMGCSTFSNFTVLPEIAVAKIREDAPFDKVCYIGCGVTTGVGAVINTAKVEPGANVRRVRPRRHRPQRHPGRAAGRRRQDHRRRHQPGPRRRWGERFGMTHFVNPKEVGGDLVAHLVK